MNLCFIIWKVAVELWSGTQDIDVLNCDEDKDKGLVSVLWHLTCTILYTKFFSPCTLLKYWVWWVAILILYLVWSTWWPYFWGSVYCAEVLVNSKSLLDFITRVIQYNKYTIPVCGHSHSVYEHPGSVFEQAWILHVTVKFTPPHSGLYELCKLHATDSLIFTEEKPIIVPLKPFRNTASATILSWQKPKTALPMDVMMAHCWFRWQNLYLLHFQWPFLGVIFLASGLILYATQDFHPLHL